MLEDKRFVTGTVAQLVGKLSINGNILGQPELSVLTRVLNGTVFKQVGSIKKGERGRPAAIWQADLETATFLYADDNAASLASDDDATVAPKVAATA